MKTFDELYNLYHTGNEQLYDELDHVDFDNLYDECDKNLSKYYEFKCWLEDAEQYYHYC